MNKNNHPSASLLFLLCLGINCFILLPTLFVQDTLTTADVGGNLYCFDAVGRGEIPYRDFHWLYGPAMLYYNALFFKILGSNIHNAMLARLVLKTIFSGVFFLAARKIMPWTASFLAALALSIFMREFPNNFSHYGGVCMEIGILWMVLSYYHHAQKKYVWGAWSFILILGFCKINFGGLFLGGVVLCFMLIDLFKHKSLRMGSIIQYGFFLISALLIWLSIYYYFIRGLSIHEINQCFPFFKGYMYYGGSWPANLIRFFNMIPSYIGQDHFNIVLFIILTLAMLRILFHLIWNHTCLTKNDRNFPLIIALLFILMMVSFHEYIKGVTDYQAYWAHPFNIILIAYIISEASVISGVVIYRIIFMACLYGEVFYGYQNWMFYKQFMVPEHFFSHKKMNVYVTTYPRDIQTMLKTEQYIEENLPPKALFYAYPAEALYYYLSDRPSPHRLIYILQVSKVTPEQEMDIISKLEKKGVEYIILNNVCYYGNMWGVFGVNNCLLVNKYIKKYFHEVARFNNFPQFPWIGNKIFKKNDPESLNIKGPQDL